MEKAYKIVFDSARSENLVVANCGCSKTEALHSFGPALKPNYVIHFILSGKGVFSMDGETYHLEAGSGFLIPPGELAFYQADVEEPWTYVWVGFSGNKAKEYVQGIGLSNHMPIFQSDQHEQLYDCVKDMMEHNTYGIANDLRRIGQLYLFLSIISREQVTEEESGKRNQYVKRAIDYIQSNYHNPIKVTDVADYVCINRSYLYSLFQQSIEMSPQQFLTKFRITKAAELLLSSSLPIESIAFSTGYNDSFVFTKAFKQMKGMSPSAYRKEMRKEESRKNREYLNQVENFLNKNQQNES